MSLRINKALFLRSNDGNKLRLFEEIPENATMPVSQEKCMVYAEEDLSCILKGKREVYYCAVCKRRARLLVDVRYS
jgi:hypothetical protein